MTANFFSNFDNFAGKKFNQHFYENNTQVFNIFPTPILLSLSNICLHLNNNCKLFYF